MATQHFHAVMTQGVKALLIPHLLVAKMIHAAEERWTKTNGEEYMTVFNPVGIDIEVSDGNDNVFGRWINDYALKEKVWAIVNDYGDKGIVCTLLLPEEY